MTDFERMVCDVWLLSNDEYDRRKYLYGMLVATLRHAGRCEEYNDLDFLWLFTQSRSSVDEVHA